MSCHLSVKTTKPYEIFIGENLIEVSAEYIKNAIKATKFAIISDDNVAPLYSKTLEDSLSSCGFSFCKFVFPHGERSKSAETLLQIYDFLAENNITRSDCLIALGGGVVGDITGFAAATFLRGIDFIQIPTTLLSQVDSSVGGKTAINISAGKNLVGAFLQPKLVLCDTKTLDSLPREYFIDGMGEVIKYGMIKSEELFCKLEKSDINSIRADIEEIVYDCLKIKAEVVIADEFDKGERMLLNFGHTLGHSVEKHYNFSGISHGVAVAIGMELITKAAYKNGIASEKSVSRLEKCLEKYELLREVSPTALELGAEAFNDKKRENADINIVICEEIGKSYVKKMPFDDFLEFLK